MKSFLKVLGWVFAFIALVGNTQVMAREGVNGVTFGAFMFWAVLSFVCFWRGYKK